MHSDMHDLRKPASLGRDRFSLLRSAAWAFLLASTYLACAGKGIAALNDQPFPVATSKKGLQVQMLDDALALGIKHAALNLNLGQLIDPRLGDASLTFQRGSRTYTFDRAYVEQMDAQIKGLSERGVLVSLIVLNYESDDARKRSILLHPHYDSQCPNRLSDFNIASEEGREWLAAAFEFMAERWTRKHGEHGQVWNWIIGNEVNSHWFWCNGGRRSMEVFARDYEAVLRLAYSSIRKYSAHSRIYVSLEHHWNIPYAGGDTTQCFPARPFLECLNARCKERGDFSWHVAFHAYPENLFEPRTWLDRSATTDRNTTPRITFRNIHLLLEFMNQASLCCEGQPRRVILSEQGFHSESLSTEGQTSGVLPSEGDPVTDGEQFQAAAYCYAYRKIVGLDGIDAFIYHRHVDHAQEGGLQLGLWTRASDSIATPSKRKLIYDVFKFADTDPWQSHFQFALPFIGIKDWSEL
jgi:Family of unknown function (DUF5722)